MRVALLALLALASCKADALQIAVPTPEGAASVVLVVERLDADTAALHAADLGGEAGQLPAIADWDERYALRITALYSRSRLADVGLAPGPIAAAAASSPSRGLPPFDSALVAEVAPGDDGVSWAPPAEMPAIATSFRVAATCPTGERARGVAIDLPRGCPFPAPAREEICWGPPVEWRALNDDSHADSHDAVGSAVVEGRDTWLYLSTDRRRIPSGANFTRPARVKLTGAMSVDARSFEDAGVLPPVEESPQGWTSPPRVRDDGLEMFFAGSWPDAHFWDEEVFLSSRTSTTARWSRAVPLTSIASNTNGIDISHKEDNDEVTEPLLLPDYKTLLYFSSHEGVLQAARRPTTTPGDTRFEPLGPLTSFERGTIRFLGLSCDGGHVIYSIDGTREPGGKVEARVVEIQGLDPLSFGPPTTIRTSTGSTTLIRHQIALTPVESPDCRTLFVSGDFKVWIAPRAPCPR